MTEQQEVNEREWADPGNWRGWLCVYSSKLDDRVWVPKRNPAMGLTLNFAHAAAWWSLLGLSIVPLGFVLLLILLRFTR